jgi:hypothetical protein
MGKTLCILLFSGIAGELRKDAKFISGSNVVGISCFNGKLNLLVLFFTGTIYNEFCVFRIHKPFKITHILASKLAYT